MAPSYGSQAGVSGYALAVSIFSSLDPDFLDVKYPPHLWKKVFKSEQINHNINAGAQDYVRLAKDKRGAAGFQSNIPGRNIPRVALSIGAIKAPLMASAIGADITNEDARQYKAGNLGTLPQDLQEAMGIGCENLVESTVFFGDPNIGFIGILSYTGITVTSAALNAGSTSRLWANKTPLEIWKDCNTALSDFYTNSNTLFVADFLGLPPTQYLALLQPMTIGGVQVANSILEYLKRNNASAAMGKELTIEPVRYLADAGAGSTNRMLLMARDKDNQQVPFPMPYQLQAPVPVPLGATLVAEQKHGSVAVWQQASVAYVDGI